MVEGSIEWAKTDVYHFIPFPSLLSKISALMYAYINFHPFADGNKRTALMTTAFFCFINGYEMTISDDAPEFTRDVAKRTADTPNHDTATEILHISNWLRPKITSNLGLRVTFRLMYSTLPKGATEKEMFESRAWQIYYRTWYSQTQKRLVRYIV